MPGQHTVFAMIPPELGQKRHRFLRPPRHQLAVHPVQRVAESHALGAHFGREQIAHRGVEGEPMRIEAVHQITGIARAARIAGREGVAQHPQRVGVLEAHGARF